MVSSPTTFFTVILILLLYCMNTLNAIYLVPIQTASKPGARRSSGRRDELRWDTDHHPYCTGTGQGRRVHVSYQVGSVWRVSGRGNEGFVDSDPEATRLVHAHHLICKNFLHTKYYIPTKSQLNFPCRNVPNSQDLYVLTTHSPSLCSTIDD